MAYKVIISPIAQKNIDEAIEYYIGNVSFQVASNFYEALQVCYKQLALNPFY